MYVDRRIETAKLAALSAGKYLLERFHKRHDSSIKEDNTVLLNEDIESENIIMDTIFKKFPSDSVFTEESETKIESEYVWVIDPLCGSYSYLRGVETWSISLALISNGDYLLGVVYQPLLDNLFYSQKGKGAKLNGKQIHVSKINCLSEAFISLEHGVFASNKVDTNKLIRSIKRLRIGHGSGAELSYVAAGFLDGVIKTDQSLMHFAGGRAIVEESGGKFIDFSGQKAPTYFDKNRKIDYIATNKILSKALLNVTNNGKNIQ